MSYGNAPDYARLLTGLGFVVQGVKEDGGNWWRTWRLRIPVGYLGVAFFVHEAVWSTQMEIVESHQSGAVPSTHRAFKRLNVELYPPEEAYEKFAKALNEMLVAFDEFQEKVGPPRVVSPVALQDYLIAALFTGTDEDQDPLDRNYSPADFSDDAKARARGDLGDFLAEMEVEVVAYAEKGIDDFDFTESDAVTDFWLTRNRHGAGFWDKPEKYGGLTEILTELAQRFGEVDVYVGDDGQLEFNP